MLNCKRNSVVFILGFILLIPSMFTINNYAYGLVDNSTISRDIQQYHSGSYEIILPAKENIYLSTNMGWPVEDIEISSAYGYRQSCSACSTYHQGIDFTPGEGSKVMAAMNGTVKEIANHGEYGVYVILEHLVNGESWQTVYAHLQYGSVPKELSVGDEIHIGDIIGAVGDTGLATGPHLHFEVRINGHKVNPLPLLYKNTNSV